jgi:hypothetical protein
MVSARIQPEPAAPAPAPKPAGPVKHWDRPDLPADCAPELLTNDGEPDPAPARPRRAPAPLHRLYLSLARPSCVVKPTIDLPSDSSVPLLEQQAKKEGGVLMSSAQSERQEPTQERSAPRNGPRQHEPTLLQLLANQPEVRRELEDLYAGHEARAQATHQAAEEAHREGREVIRHADSFLEFGGPLTNAAHPQYPVNFRGFVYDHIAVSTPQAPDPTPEQMPHRLQSRAAQLAAHLPDPHRHVRNGTTPASRSTSQSSPRSSSSNGHRRHP